jgi:putative tryptophan/tyrosine transport system substrate-binding protein
LSTRYSGKWLELLKAAVPKLSRVAVLWNPDNRAAQEYIATLDEMAGGFDVTLTNLSVRPPEFETSLAAIALANFDGLIVTDDAQIESLIPRIVSCAARNRLPAIYGFGFAVRQGGLMAYSADFFEIWRRLAGHVDRILKGAKPGDLPIEQATEIKLAINLTTAKALGLDIPTNLLAAANEVVE